MGMENKCSSTQESSSIVSSLLLGNSNPSSANVKDFLALAFTNSRSNYCKITIHFEYFPIDDSTGQNMSDGVHFYHYSLFSRKYIRSKSLDNLNYFKG